jgi:lysophospholipase L1-like esterase
MLVLGDSIMWGQGLKPEHKSWYLVKTWIEKETGRTVRERIEAHSGAVIERASATDDLSAADPEVNVGLPTIHEELDSAVRFYSDSSQVDLVLLNGCGNDVGVHNLLNASNEDEITRRAEAKCGGPMEKLLSRIVTSFPAAQIIVAGYYPLFSERTKNDFILKALVRSLFKAPPGAAKISSKEVFQRLRINSKHSYAASNKALTEAVRRVNGDVAAGRERVRFATIEFPPEYSFAARETRLWDFNRSPFRMMLVVLSFGKILLPTNDDVRRQRTRSCKQVFMEQPKDTAEMKKERKSQLLLCRYAALGHPNRKGAVLYANAITEILKTSLPSGRNAEVVR